MLNKCYGKFVIFSQWLSWAGFLIRVLGAWDGTAETAGQHWIGQPWCLFLLPLQVASLGFLKTEQSQVVIFLTQQVSDPRMSALRNRKQTLLLTSGIDPETGRASVALCSVGQSSHRAHSHLRLEDTNSHLLIGKTSKIL